MQPGIFLEQATAGAAESNACGDSVRPTERLARLAVVLEAGSPRH
jgi:hypothetical protein